MKDILVYCFVVVLCIHISHQCRCPLWGRVVKVEGEDVPQTLCSDGGKYVYAEIKSKTKNYDTEEYRFDVNMFQMITSSEVVRYPYGNNTALFAPLSSAMCGYIDFEIGKRVYVSVSEHYNSKDKLFFNGCSFGRYAEEVTYVQLQVMKGKLSCPDIDYSFGPLGRN